MSLSESPCPASPLLHPRQEGRLAEVQPLMPGCICRKGKGAATGRIHSRRVASWSQFGFHHHQMSPRSVGWTDKLGFTAPCDLMCLFCISSSTRHLSRLCHMNLSSQLVLLQCAALEIVETHHLWIDTIGAFGLVYCDHVQAPLGVQFAVASIRQNIVEGW